MFDGATFESQAAFIESGGRCATKARGRIPRAPAADEIQEWMAVHGVQAGASIPVAFHVIHAVNGEGNVPEAWLDAQIEVLNNTYAGRDYDGGPVQGAARTGFSFHKASVDRTANSSWFRMAPGSNTERTAKTALRISPETTLNVYTCKPGHFLLGWSTFPWELATDPDVDGVVIHYASLPGGPLAPYNLGGTAVHEIGHWVGLLHTFQGGCGDEGSPGCETTGDQVCDTPGEAGPAFGCPIGLDTCPGPGLDPIHNYMDYTDDACYDNFTDGQSARATFLMATYRSGIVGSRVALHAGGVTQGARHDPAWRVRVDPNPLNPRARITLDLDHAGTMQLRLVDVRGRLVRTFADRELAAGPHVFELDGSGLASGVYLLVARSGGNLLVRRVAVLK